MDETLIKVAESLEALSMAIRELANQPSKFDEQSSAKQMVTLEKVRAVLGKLSIAGQSEQVKAIIQKYGHKLSEVDPSHYEEMLKEAEAIANAAS